MKILYIGEDAPSSTSIHRARSIQRIGHEVTIINPRSLLKDALSHSFWSRVHYRTGYRYVQASLGAALGRSLEFGGKCDLAWIDSGELFSGRLVEALRAHAPRVLLYNLDDPTGCRDGARWHTLKGAIPFYDLIATVRAETEGELKSLGARNVLRVWRSYDEVEHHPPSPEEKIESSFLSKVCFVGTWMPGRDAFMERLMQRGVPLSIWGNRWQKAPKWKWIRHAWRGPAISGRDYVHAIAGACISLGLLSAGNRDLHTQRSFEIPYIGSVFCAERTDEHRALYVENVEAVYWNDADECASACLSLLGDVPRLEAIRRAGMQKVRRLRVGNEDIARAILNAVSTRDWGGLN